MEQNADICNRMIAGGEFSDLVFKAIAKEVYFRLKEVNKG
jgi:hypothetical protein